VYVTSKGVGRKISRERGLTEKRKIALLSLFQGEGDGNEKKDRKIALLSLYLLHQYHV